MRRPLVLGAAGVALAAAIWLAASGRGVWATAVRMDAASAPEPGPPEPASAAVYRTTVAGAASADTVPLRLQVRRADGKSPRGRVLWTASAHGPCAPSLMAPELSPSLSGPDVRQLEHVGRAMLEVPVDAWLWVRVTDDHPPLACAYLRLPPLREARDLDVLLLPGERAIHAFALRADLRTPAARATVTLLARQTGAGAAAVVATQQTNERGYACFRGLGPAAYVVLAPGAGMMDGPPHAQAVVLMPGTPLTEVPSTVVVPEPELPVTLRLRGAFGSRRGYQVRAYLRGRGDREGALVPLPRPLQDGEQVQQLRVPEGLWELQALPLGCFTVEPQTVLHINAGHTEHVVGVHETDVLTEVTLSGIEPGDLPMRVYARRPADLQIPDATPMYLGPHRWNLPTLTVFGKLENVRLVAIGARGPWLSGRTVSLRGGATTVDLVPAAKVEVTWLADGPGSPARGQTDLSWDGQTETVQLVPRLVIAGGALRRALQGGLVVPQGTVAARGFDVDTGEPAWTRTVTVVGPAVQVRIDADP